MKSGKGEKLMGFGHRIYKNYDPRAKIIKRIADEVFEVTGMTNRSWRSRSSWRRSRCSDEYFVSRKLYPNVDFYSGTHLSGHGHSDLDVHRALRDRAHDGLDGSVAGDALGPEQKIARPRQVYIGPGERHLSPIEQR